MKVLVIGNGAREHALAWKFAASKRICGLYIAPGNAGTAEAGQNLPDVDPADHDAVLKVCRDKGINLVFIGPEAPLADGLADSLRAASLSVIGPGKEAAQLESSKAFSKEFMLRHGIPTAAATEVGNAEELAREIQEEDRTYVLKKSGLAAGKGVLESSDAKELKEFGAEIFKGKDTLLVEEFLEGYEISVFVLLDGERGVVLPPCSDFKKAQEGDKGPNTGGMGAICPVPWVDSAMMAWIQKEIVDRSVEGLRKDGLLYQGVLFIGLMITKEGPRVLEYNVRFGDPESQVLLPLIESDFGNLAEAMVNGALDQFKVRISPQSATGVVVASPGYPGKYPKGLEVKDAPATEVDGGLIFHASTIRDENDKVLTNGGRCFTAVNFGSNTLKATVRAYETVKKVQFEGAWYRHDIGKKYFIES